MDTETRTVLYNRRQVIMVALADNEARRDPGYDVAHRTVRLRAALERRAASPDRSASIVPEGRDRLSDWARHADTFRYIETGETTLLVNIAHVDRSQRGTEAVSTAPIDALFHAMAAAGASDLHLSVDSPPIIRKDGRLQPLDPAAAAAHASATWRRCSSRSCRRRTATSSTPGTTPTSPTRSPAWRGSAPTCSPIAKGRARCSA